MKTEITKERDMIFTDLFTTHGSNESVKVYQCTNVNTGESELVIEKTITERYPVTKLEKVIDLYERLTCGSGRKVWSLNEIAHKHNPNH